MTIEAICFALGAKASGKRFRAACPAHGSGKKLTLVISEREDGSTGIHCFAGCSADDILAAVGLDKKEAWKPIQKYNSLQHQAACERSQRIIELTLRQRRDLAGIMAYLDAGRPMQAVTMRRYDEIVVDLFHAVPRLRREAREIIGHGQHEAIILALTHGELMPMLTRAIYRLAQPGEKNYTQKH